MTKVSRKKLDKQKLDSLIDQLWTAIFLLQDKSEIKDFLNDILTRTEKVMLSKRLEIVKMLEEGKSYDQIRRELNVTDSTIAKINNWYEEFGKGYKLVIDRLRDLEEKKKKGKSSK